MQLTQYPFQQINDFLTRTTITYTASSQVDTYLSRASSSLHQILQSLPDSQFNQEFELLNRSGKLKTVILKSFRPVYIPPALLPPLAIKYQTNQSQAGLMIESLSKQMQTFINGDVQRCQQIVELLPAYLRGGEFEFQANPLAHFHFVMSSESLDVKIQEMQKLDKKNLQILNQDISGLDDTDYLQILVVIQTTVNYQPEVDLIKTATDLNIRVFMVAESDLQTPITKKPNYNLLNSLYLDPLNQKRDIPLRTFNGFFIFQQNFAQFYGQFVRDKIQLLSNMVYEQKLFFKKEKEIQVSLCCSKNYYMKYTNEMKIRRLIDLLVQNSLHAQCEQFIQEALNRHGKQNKVYTAELLFLRCVNHLNNAITTTDQKELLMISMKQFFLQINDCFNGCKPTGNYNYYNSQLIAPLSDQLKYEQYNDKALYKDFKLTFSQCRALITKIKLEIYYGLIYTFVIQNNLLPAAYACDVMTQTKILYAAFNHRLFLQSYLLPVQHFYSSQVIFKYLSTSDELKRTKQCIVKLTYTPKTQLYSQILAMNNFLMHKDYTMATQMTQIIKQFANLGLEPIRQFVLQLTFQTLLMSLDADEEKNAQIIEHMKIILQQLVNYNTKINFSQLKSQGYRSDLMQQRTQSNLTQAPAQRCAIEMFQQTKMPMFNKVNFKVYLNGISENFEILEPLEQLDVISSPSIQSEFLKQLYNSLSKSSFIDPFMNKPHLNQEKPYHHMFKLEEHMKVDQDLRSFKYSTTQKIIQDNNAAFNDNNDYHIEMYPNSSIAFSLELEFAFKNWFNLVLVRGVAHCFVNAQLVEIDIQSIKTVDESRFRIVMQFTPMDLFIINEQSILIVKSLELQFENITQIIEINKQITIHPEKQTTLQLQMKSTLKQFELIEGTLVFTKPGTYKVASNAMRMIHFQNAQKNKEQQEALNLAEIEDQIIFVQQQSHLKSELARAAQRKILYQMQTKLQKLDCDYETIIVTEDTLQQQFSFYAFENVQTLLFTVIDENNLMHKIQQQLSIQTVTQPELHKTHEWDLLKIEKTVAAFALTNLDQNAVKCVKFQDALGFQQTIQPKQGEQFHQRLPYKQEMQEINYFGKTDHISKFAMLLLQEDKNQLNKNIIQLHNYLETSFNVGYKDNKDAKAALEKATIELKKDILNIQNEFQKIAVKAENIVTIVGAIFVNQDYQSLLMYKLTPNKIPLTLIQCTNTQTEKLSRYQYKLANYLSCQSENIIIKVKSGIAVGKQVEMIELQPGQEQTIIMSVYDGSIEVE
ncbi:Conserved_hypothetical protein [Hexamita inflata]|uniref:Uncharacterized protein n=1 Tax=Hexamita inflata TaxID=28002 RepID=A0AA86N7I6_9EUKA|nr:Conserved hypothetical protein [Hexamita inflata]